MEFFGGECKEFSGIELVEGESGDCDFGDEGEFGLIEDGECEVEGSEEEPGFLLILEWVEVKDEV